MGGAGAILSMWMTALTGMATKYAEAVCAVKYRETDERGKHVGGPMYYIKNGLGAKWQWLPKARATQKSKCDRPKATPPPFGTYSPYQGESGVCCPPDKGGLRGKHPEGGPFTFPIGKQGRPPKATATTKSTSDNMINATETTVKHLIQFCELEWEPACLDFHQTTRPVRTSSSWQVRQPVYGRSLNRWKNYATQLAPLRDVLEGAGLVPAVTY